MRRVVVTGLGAITPLGIGARHTWSRLLAGDSGIVSVSHLQPQARWAELPSRVAGLVPLGAASEGGWQASDWVDRSEERRMAKFTQYAVAATEMALKDAGWRPETQEQREMTGVCLGSGIGNLDDVVDTSVAYHNGVSRPFAPQFVATCLLKRSFSNPGLQESLATLRTQASD